LDKTGRSSEKKLKGGKSKNDNPMYGDDVGTVKKGEIRHVTVTGVPQVTTKEYLRSSISKGGD